MLQIKKNKFILVMTITLFLTVLFTPNKVEAKWINSYGTWKYSDSNGKLLTSQWLKYNGSWYYFDAGTSMVNDGEHEDSNNVSYIFGKDGKLLTNQWYQKYGNWYYAGSTGRAYENQWLKYNGSWYYFDSSTTMVSDGEHEDSNYVSYIFGRDGKLLTNQWYQKYGNWYYAGPTGRAYENQWLKYNGSWYYFDSSTTMVTGEKTINGVSYYFNVNGTLSN
jgi:glucan-binding YG repeat protein